MLACNNKFGKHLKAYHNRGNYVFHQPASASFIDLIETACETYADKPCLQFKDKKYSYADVDSLSAYIASDLVKAGFKTGDTAAVYSLNSARTLIATLGILRAGGVWVPINPRNSEVENIRVLSTLECKAVFHQDRYDEAVDRVEEMNDSPIIRINIDHETFTNKPAKPLKAPTLNLSPDALISLPMTGGTTGQSKSVMLSHANFNALAYGLQNWYQDYTGTPVILCVAPLTHVGGRIALTSMISGACMIVHEKFDAIDILQAIQSEKVTDVFLPPTAIYSLLDTPALETYNLQSLKNFLYGSAPMSVEKLKQALEIFGPVMRGAYGQTECPLFITEMRPQDHFVNGKIAPDERLRSVGHATHLSTVAIFDDFGKPVPTGELGEIATKGPMACQGYYNNKVETDKIQCDGWHLTGDIGYLNTDGFLYIMDRKKDMIITGGFNVYSAEVENVINKIPGVRVSQVIGIPSKQWGEAVKALVQKDPQIPISAKEISDICRDQLGSVKMPKTIEFRDDFPITPLGKIDKKALRAAYWPET